LAGPVLKEGINLRVLLAFPVDATFVRTDLDLLRSFCDVTPLHFHGKASYSELLRGVATADVVVSWFALGFAGIANLMGKPLRTKSLVIAGGWDVVGMPEIAYGCLLSEWGVLRARLSLTTADRVLAFSNWSRDRIHEVAPKSKVETAYLGIDIEEFRPGIKENVVVTVSNVNEENLLRKGLRTVVDAARNVPEAEFVVVGTHADGAARERRRGDLPLVGARRVPAPARLHASRLRGG